jgi:hypothetical protein
MKFLSTSTLGGLAAAAVIALAVGAPASAQRNQRYQISENDVAETASALSILNFVLEQRVGMEDSLVSIQPYDIPGNLFVRMEGDDRWHPYTIISEEQRAQLVKVNVLDPAQGNYVDMVFGESESVNSESPIGALAGLLGIGFSSSYRTHFKFEPVLTARGPSYGPGNPALLQQINEYSVWFQQAGFETYYVNSVDVYRSLNERYVSQDRQLNAGFALVSGGRVYSRETSQTRQRVHYVLNATKVVPAMVPPPPPGSPFASAATRSLGSGRAASDADVSARFSQAATYVAQQAGATRDAGLQSELARALTTD